jgi:signal peptide peptidase SppA
MWSEILGGTSLDLLSLQLAQARDDTSTRSIVLHVDSPGGGVYGIDEMANQIAELNKHKPVIAFVDGLGASAAYWLIAGASHIVATPSAELGSIGVYAVHFDTSRALDQEGVTPTLIKAGEFKAEANPYQPLSDEDREAMQQRIDAHYTRFVSRIAKGRGVSAGKVRESFGRGRVLDATQAEACGMATEIGGWPDVLRIATTEARTRAHTTQQQPRPRVASAESLRLQLAMAEAAI